MNRKSIKNRCMIPGVVGLALGVAALPAAGQVSYEWTALGDGVTFSDPMNWLPNAVPGALDEAKFDAAGSETVNFVSNPSNAKASIENDTVVFNLTGRVYTAAELIVGDRLSDIGVLTVSGGSLVTTTGLARIGHLFTASGSMFLTNGAAMTNQRDLVVGNKGDGYFQLDAGCTANSNITFIGDSAGATGEALVRGTWTVQTGALVGNTGAGVLTIDSGGDMTVGTTVKVGDDDFSSGSITVDGAGSTLSVVGSTTIGNFGHGVLTVSNGAVLSTAALKIADDFLGEVLIDNASVIDLVGTGVGNRAAGTLTLANGGSIQSPLVSVVASGTLGGKGTITGSVANEGFTNPGNGTGPLTVTGNFTQLLGTLNIELGGSNAGVDYDQLVVNGVATLSGTLNVSLVNGYNPASGQFVILQGGTISGAFAAENLPPNFAISYEADRVVVSIGDPCVADFNGDGSVNTQDVLAFLNAWVAGDANADINGDGNVNTLDFIAYLNIWVAGC